MDKKEKDMKGEAKNANHSKEETTKGAPTSKSTDHKMENKKEGAKKEDEKKSNPSNTRG